MTYAFHGYYEGHSSTPNPPWDAVITPNNGDRRRSTLFQAVGHALSNWEDAEFQIARLYAALVNRPAADMGQFATYSFAAGFRGRADALEVEADRHFASYPNQEFECQFTRLVAAARNFSQRRNDIAHGIARQAWLPGDGPNGIKPESETWMLVPCLYMGKRFTSDGPIYAYSSFEIRQWAEEYGVLAYYARLLSVRVALQRSGASP